MALTNTQKSSAGILCSVAVIISIVLSSGNVRTNQDGLELIGNAESCRRDPYVCPAGVLTDGLGNTHGVVRGTVKTDAQIAKEWEANILEAEKCVDRYADGRRLPSDIFSAAVSVTFRAGCGNMRKSTMFSLFREGPMAYKSACNQFSRWVWGGGKILPGLVTRAGKETNLCLRGVPVYE